VPERSADMTSTTTDQAATGPEDGSGDLAGRLAATVAHVRGIAPPDLFDVFAAEQRRLADAPEPPAQIRVGDRLPQSHLTDHAGRPVAVPGDGPVVLVFYRGAWCPYCDVALRAYQRELLPELTERGVRLVAISPQGPDGSLSAAEAAALTFPVLSDVGNGYARMLGLTFDLDPEVQEAQLAFGNDFTTINADGDWTLPRPTVVVADAHGVVRFVDVRPDYTERTEPAEVLAAVRALG
ncbi:peroxiredoxin-like family protein, partial [Nocardioides kribbensis]|uniref:peroxiredoxin-like family protein n=2 Tax=Nocardioidaceae TaxID=85015 RepID=UPI0032DBA001